MFAATVACVGMFVLVLMGWSVPLGPGSVPLSSYGPTQSLPENIADLGSDFGLVRLQNTLA